MEWFQTYQKVVMIRFVKQLFISYQNSTEAVDQFTNCAVRQLTVIHPVDELSMMEELGKIATFADMQ